MSTKRIRSLESEVKQAESNLASRWNNLELEVAGLANTAKEEVNHTVQHAKESISITHQVSKRPWAMLAGAVATGVALSRMTGFKSLAVFSLATPIVKDALNSASFSQMTTRSPSPTNDTKGKVATGSSDGGLLDLVRNKAVNSLADIAKELVKRNAPTSLVPVMEQAITSSAQSMLASNIEIERNPERNNRIIINDDDEGISVH